MRNWLLHQLISFSFMAPDICNVYYIYLSTMIHQPFHFLTVFIIRVHELEQTTIGQSMVLFTWQLMKYWNMPPHVCHYNTDNEIGIYPGYYLQCRMDLVILFLHVHSGIKWCKMKYKCNERLCWCLCHHVDSTFLSSYHGVCVGPVFSQPCLNLMVHKGHI